MCFNTLYRGFFFCFVLFIKICVVEKKSRLNELARSENPNPLFVSENVKNKPGSDHVLTFDVPIPIRSSCVRAGNCKYVQSR